MPTIVNNDGITVGGVRGGMEGGGGGGGGGGGKQKSTGD